MPHGRTTPLVLLILSALAGCGPSAAVGVDAGPPPDAGPLDPVAPTVRSTTPASGEAEVPREAELVVRFSEPMARDAGTIRVAPGGAGIAASEGDWDEAGSVLTIVPATPWPAGEVTLTFEGDFEDLAGNALVPTSITITTVDDVAPTVVETTPAEGATDVGARTSEIVIRFDEPMRTTAGTLDVLGGAATLSPPVWSADATTVTFGVADLEHEREYDVRLRGFLDANGNRLNGTPYLEDGVLDFTVGPDVDGPRVVRSEPAEGQVDVDPADLDAILVTFDEAMDTSIAAVTLSDGTTSVPLTGTWTGSGRILRVEVTGLLAFGADYALDLTMLRDRADNPVDAATYLVDGRLDFSVGDDEFLPFVRSSTPIEGEAEVSYTETTQIRVTFSEAMDTSIVTAPLSGGAAAIVLTGTWASDSQIVFAITAPFPPGAAMSLDLRGMRDSRGNPLNASHVSLGDGRLDFTTSAPIGEGCADPLTIGDATLDAPGVYSWRIGSLQGSTREGGTSACDANGTTANGTDVLVRYDKTFAAPGDGGRYLRVTLDASTTDTGSNTFDVAVATGAACDPAAVPVRCHSNAGFHHFDIDVPAGPVWIWVSRSTVSSTAVSATLTVTEVAPPRIEGDSCDAPYTTASAVYTAPVAPSMVHRFAIPQNALRSVDIDPIGYAGPSEMSCDTTAGYGIDGVIRFDKPDDASILRVSARRTAGSDSLNLEVLSACDASLPATRSLGCRTGITTTAQDMLIDAPAGPVFVWVGDTLTTVSRSAGAWLTSSAVDVEVEVIPDVAAGEICSRAIAATAGVNAVSGTSDERFQAPSCFGATSDVQWYRLTTTQDVVLVSANAAGGLALVDPASATTLSCVSDGMARTLTRALPVGTSVCIGVEMGRGITSIDVRGQDYDGLGSTPPVDLEILRPYNSTASAEESVTSDYWMAVSGSTLVMRHTSSAVMDVSRTGHERAVRRGTDDGITSTELGRGGLFVNGALFSISSSTTASSTRVRRLWDGRSPFWSPVVWDITPPYPASVIQAAAQDGSSSAILYATSTATLTTFFRITTDAPATPVVVGTNSMLVNLRGLVADDTYVYAVAAVGGLRGVYRVPRASVGAAPFALVRSVDFDGSTTSPSNMALDSLSAPRNLYVRNDNGHVEAIIDPAGAMPFYLGPVIERGTSSDFAMTLDHATGQLYLFETDTLSTGVWLRYDP